MTGGAAIGASAVPAISGFADAADRVVRDVDRTGVLEAQRRVRLAADLRPRTARARTATPTTLPVAPSSKRLPHWPQSSTMTFRMSATIVPEKIGLRIAPFWIQLWCSEMLVVPEYLQ